MKNELLSCVEVCTADEIHGSVIWLHGLGADGHDFEPIVPHLGIDPGLGLRFVFPHAPRRPVTINMGMVMRAWYDIRELSLKRDVDEKGVLESAEQIRALIAREIERGLPSHRIVIAGFSQGGALAMYVALRYESKLAGLLPLSCYMVCDDDLEAERSDENRSIPIFQAHGTEDPMVPPAAGEMARDRMTSLGYDVVWKTYPMGHEVNAEEIVDVGEALNGFFRRP